MISLGALLPVVTAYGAAVITPGVSTVVIARMSLAAGRSRGARTALGVATGTVLYASASLFGLAALVQRLPFLLKALQVGGALYLGWLGARLVLLRPGLELEGTAEGVRPQDAYVRGLMTNLSNPHTVLFFMGIFGTLLQPSTPAGERTAALLAVGSMSVTWYVGLALVLSDRRAQAGYQRAARGIDVLAGAIMLVFAARFAASALG